ncbi:hypothetical protein EON73_00320 [bacterium]|nr:MAG: hypothetical protein EON73_00320 [bacterium]
MVVKILSSSSTFNGVSYNTKKTDKDLGELMKAENFGYLENFNNVQPNEYKNYLIFHSTSNTRMKDKQFHAVISCKEKEYNKYQLTSIAEQYLKEMGYGNNPYLIVFHKDTANNHVHMVSSRIDKEGKRINRDFEGKRSSTVIEKILNNDIKLSANKLVEAALHYSISTVPQFKLLFERRGYNVWQDDKNIVLRKFDNIQQQIPIEKVNELITQSTKDDKRIRQLKAIFEKYKTLVNPDVRVLYEPSKFKDEKKPIGYTSELAEVLKSKFGLDVIYHGKSGLPPYGYTIIDNKEKAVFKGGEIMPLSLFIDHSPYQKQLQLTNGSINIQNDGFDVSAKIVGEELSKSSFADIPKERLDQLKVLLKSTIHEFNSIGEGLNRHKIEILRSENDLYVLDKISGFKIDAKRVLNPTDYLLIAKRSGLTLPQKEKAVFLRTDQSQAYSLRGTIKSYGNANYKFEKEGKPSFFIELLKSNGTQKIVWGIDLQRAITQSEYHIGDHVQLNYKGFNEFKISIPVKDAEDHVISYEDKIVKRNDWELIEPDEYKIDNQYEGRKFNIQGSELQLIIGEQEEISLFKPIQDFELSIADDIDDEQINGRNRRRERKARTNTR